MRVPCFFCEIQVVNDIYGSIIQNDVFYLIRYSTLSRGRKHCNTYHGVLTTVYRPDPNESGSVAGLTPNLQNQR